MESTNILVTGIGGDFGQAIVKCLCLMERPLHLLGCDIAPEVGTAFVDGVFTVPRANDPDYLPTVQELCRHHRVAAVIPASEAEIEVLSRAVFAEGVALGAVLVCQQYQWFQAYGDKLACFQNLAGRVELVPFADGGDVAAVHRFVQEVGFPCVVKSRRSWGSKSIQIARNEEELTAMLARTSLPLVQQYIDDGLGEFSVGVFRNAAFTTAVAFKRDLGPVGASWYADNFDQDQEVLAYALAIAEASAVQGSCNVQVRKSAKGVRLLEINPRFSSLVAARALCGFRDLEWSLLEALGEEVAAPPDAYARIRFRRFFHELVDSGNGYRGIAAWRPRET